MRLKEYYERTNERTRGVSEHLKTLVRKATGSTPTLHCIVMRSAEAAKQDYSAMMCRESNDTPARPSFQRHDNGDNDRHSKIGQKKETADSLHSSAAICTPSSIQHDEASPLFSLFLSMGKEY